MAILKVLSRCADDAGACGITREDLADRLDVAERTARRGITALETLGIVSRSRRQASERRGRAADLISLKLDHDFTLTKEQIMRAKRMGPTGQNVLLNVGDQPDKMSTGPKEENPLALYKERARSVMVKSSPLHLPSSLVVYTHVRLDRARSKWRATITTMGVTMDLGRFDTEVEAKAYADQAEADVRRTSTMKAGTPSFPVIDPSKAKLNAPDIGTWLFGDDDEEPCENGAGEASALGQGTKFLAGLGGAHERPECDAARAGEVRQ
ncbi:hypothetical protein [Agrobacterium radiobacter]|uniref:hypothetical protein n=1 Tax=Agrobacterium radiobacter TaxID=362 RepID=UPI001606D36B|nr:hypothetical protein [Agrobacterium radiobacter]MBB4407075.1 hypothetical protein [Agrobacterium radiobacter]MBB4452721.1 hypothetical protein [Agrobacterium radiobacter]